MLRAGSLRRQITIEAPTYSQNALGEPVKSWSTFLTTWASIENLAGREQIIAQQVNAAQTYTITVRWYAGITEEMRVRYGSRVFEIQTCSNVEERNRVLELLCIEVQTAAATEAQ